MATGYYIEESPEFQAKLPENDIVKRFGRIRMVHWPLIDGPIDFYLKHPELYIVTPFETEEKESDTI